MDGRKERGYMKNRMRQIVALTLCAAMAAGLCACGSADGTSKGEGKHYFNVTYLDQLPDNFGQLGGSMFKGDCLYYTAYDENDDYSIENIYSYNLLDGSEETIWQGKYETTEDGITIESNGVNNFTVDEDGNVYAYMYANKVKEESLNKDYSSATLDDVLDYMVSEWGYEENDAAADWDAYYKDDYTDEDGTVNYGQFLKQIGMEYDYFYVIQKLDAEGNVVYEIPMEDQDSDDYYINSSDMEVDKNGYLYVVMNRWNADGTEDVYYVDVYDTDGTKKGSVDFDDYTYNVLALSDGRVGCVCYGDKTVLAVIDPDTMSISDNYEVASANLSPYDGNTMLVNNNASLYLYNLEDQSEEEFLTWMDCNISSSSVSSFGMLSDGSLGVLTQTWGNSGVSTEIAILNEVDASEIVQKKEIEIACMWLDSDLEQLAIEYNKKHEDYHITITQYYDDSLDDWDAMLSSFTTAVANDTDIDIVVFDDYSQVTNFAAKGLMADLYPLIENDSELSKDDFLPNILKACEFDGSLLVLPKSFSVSTVVGRTEDVGAESGWTIDDVKALLASKPEGTELFESMTRDTMLSRLISLNYRDFIDPVNATCSFDTQEFVDVLEFANMFPEEYEWDEDTDSADMLHNGQVLLDTYYLSDFEEIQLYEVVFGGPLTFIGYPTSDGNGALLSLNSIYGITNNCDVPDVAWDFLRQFYLPEDSDSEYYYGFSIRKDEFEKYCTDAMKEDDEYGSYSYGWGNYEVEIQPATQEQVDTVKDLVYNTTAVSGAVSSDIMNLIQEEAAYYFSGEQSAENVAAKIQSRMEIYLSETK
jgi:ABC-type glycerol-3-phosphate transport system substrate-binding protein